MKKLLYYSSIAGLAILFWFGFGWSLAPLWGGLNHHGNFNYMAGEWCGQPFIMLLAIGTALLFQPLLSKKILNVERGNKAAIWFISIGFILGFFKVATNFLF